ncbi:hypothetical protein NEOKW01_0450 [Nematocida sp. AWRm80]|nr:hypothetical protein NEOKW01_0450 [Nematocida sp. AWRm80]
MYGQEEETNIELEESKRARPSEGSIVLQQQMEATEALQALQTRKFTFERVPITTAGGSKLWTYQWVTKSARLNKPNEPVPVEQVCDICNREFADSRRLAIHKNVHLKAAK